MTPSNYLIKYSAFDKGNKVIKCGTMRVKNKLTEAAAKVGLENHLRSKLPAFDRMVVHECSLDYEGYMMDFLKKYGRQ